MGSSMVVLDCWIRNLNLGEMSLSGLWTSALLDAGSFRRFNVPDLTRTETNIQVYQRVRR